MIEGEYVVVCRWGTGSHEAHIPSGTDEEAHQNAEMVVKLLKARLSSEGQKSAVIIADIYHRIESFNSDDLVAEKTQESEPTSKIQTYYRCEICKLIAEKENFCKEGVDDFLCPKCGNLADIFPYRLFKCKSCGKVADQNEWFPEQPLDDHPLECKHEAISCEECTKKWDSLNPPKRSPQNGLENYMREYERVVNLPAELVEVQVDPTPQ